MRRNWIFLLAIIILATFQTTILDYFKIFGVKPDLILITVVIASLILEWKWAFGLAVFAGVLKDVFGPNSFGINTLLFPLWSFLIIKLSKKISIDNNLIRAVFTFIIMLTHNIITRLIFLSLGKFIPLGIFLRIAFLESLYTALVLSLVFKIIEIRLISKLVE